MIYDTFESVRWDFRHQLRRWPTCRMAESGGPAERTCSLFTPCRGWYPPQGAGDLFRASFPVEDGVGRHFGRDIRRDVVGTGRIRTRCPRVVARWKSESHVCIFACKPLNSGSAGKYWRSARREFVNKAFCLCAATKTHILQPVASRKFIGTENRRSGDFSVIRLFRRVSWGISGEKRGKCFG